MQMDFELRIAPAGRFAHVAAREAVIGSRHLLPLALGCNHRVDRQQQPARLRRQLVERAAQHFMRKPVGHGDVGQRNLDVLDLSLIHISAKTRTPAGTLRINTASKAR